MKKSLKIENVSISYQKDYFALYNINCEFFLNHNYMIVGESESGKSTFARFICGLEKKYTGNVYLDDNNVDFENSFFKNEIVFLPSIQVFFENKTALDNLKYAYSIRNVDNSLDFSGVLEKFNLLDMSNEKLKNLSKYEKVLLSLARAYLRKFTFLVVDEAFTGLSSNELKTIINKIKLLDYKTLIITSKNEYDIFKREFKITDIINIKAGFISF